MDKPYPPEAWKALGRALELRREQMGYGRGQRTAFAQHRGWLRTPDHPDGHHLKTLIRLEAGRPTDYMPGTLREIERVYELDEGAVEGFLDAVAAGETAVLAGPPLVPPRKPSPDGHRPGDELLDQIMRLPELTVDEKRMFVEIARGMRARREAEEIPRERQGGSRQRNGETAGARLPG